MTLRRDSFSLTLLALAAALGYLAMMPPPTQWTYQQWIQTALGAVLWLSGKGANSPLMSKAEADSVTPRGEE